MSGGRRPIAAVIGDARAGADDLRTAEQLGAALVDAGFRLVTGGLGGTMRAASAGARAAAGHQPGDVIGVLPTYVAEDANEFVEVTICTGLNHARNVVVVASADVVFALGGKSGTLSEIAFAWKLGKPVIVVGEAPGWATLLAGIAIDDRREDRLYGPLAPDEAARFGQELLAGARLTARGF
ncbi:MAG: hypothetical protein JWM10_14 [Myxococcaceae bacterium]|nr:hypothetical protein [Myxococcaceae bacterium]